MNTHAPTEIDSGNWQQYAAAGIDPSLWTAVVPAAGHGSRLGYDRPKILYPILGRPVLHWLLDFLAPNCRRVVFVLSPQGRAPVEEELGRCLPGRYAVVVQAVATGMGDAVQMALPSVDTRHVVVVWGDQVALRRCSVDACMRLHTGPLAPDITCPTVFRDHPYIHFERDSDDHILAMLQAREGDRMPERGESDTGFFCFKTEVLGKLLDELRRTPQQAGHVTKEFNMVPVVPLASRTGLTVITPHLMTLEETVGVNSKDDVSVVEAFLQNSNVCSEPQGR